MSKFKTKAEAQQAIQDMEDRAARCVRQAARMDVNDAARSIWREDAAQYRAEAARIRALLPTLPEAGS